MVPDGLAYKLRESSSVVIRYKSVYSYYNQFYTWHWLIL